MVTIVNLVEAYSPKPKNSVWIVPGTLSDFDAPENEDRHPHLDDYLPIRGVLVCSKIPPDAAEALVQEIAAKFRQAGITAQLETLSND
jgi:hypothetical protein